MFCSNDSASGDKTVEEDDVFERIKEDSLSERQISVQNITEDTEEERDVKQNKDETFDKDLLSSMSSEELVGQLGTLEVMKKDVFILELLIKREGKSCLTPEGSLCEMLQKLYCKAGRVQDWNVIRHCSGLLRKIVDSLAPAISTILVHGKVVSLINTERASAYHFTVRFL